MTRTLGVLTTERISVGMVEGNQIIGEVLHYPERDDDDVLRSLNADALVAEVANQIQMAAPKEEVRSIGLGVPGVIRGGVIEESPNLQQLKGYNVQQALQLVLGQRGISATVSVCNDADVMAAGIAATRGQLDRLIRVWTLGNGIGFGRYPSTEGVWEGGHSVVTLDPKETFCGCGGTGHLEGIMGHRAMRLRFLDLEPDEIFEHAQAGDARCADFVRLWHRALAAATATNIHMEGPGKFYITGPNAGFVNIDLLNRHMQQMVKMSPLQGYVFEIVPGGADIAIIGAAVNAARAARTL